MSYNAQRSKSPSSKGGCAVPCLLIFGVFLLTGFLLSSRPFGGALLAAAVIGITITLLVRRNWQNNVFGFFGVNSTFKRYFVLGTTICLMSLTFISTEMEKADVLWAEGKKSEAVEIYEADLKYSILPSPKVIERIIEYYFEKGDMNQAKHFCNMAVEANVELSPKSKELRDLYSMVRAEHARMMEEQKVAEDARRKAELAKQEADEVRKKTEVLEKDDFTIRVLPATPVQLDNIGCGLEKGFALQRDAAWMVKSSVHKNAYYVVIFFNGPGVSDVLGAWLCSGDPNGTGMVLSANSQATEFSLWPNGARSKAQAWITDEDCSKLLAYARRQKQ